MLQNLKEGAPLYIVLKRQAVNCIDIFKLSELIKDFVFFEIEQFIYSNSTL